MPDEKRVVLIKPGDVLLIGGVQFDDAMQIAESANAFKDAAGLKAVVFFDADIQLDSLTAEQLARLTTAKENPE